MVGSKWMVGAGLDQRDLASTYVLYPSHLLIPNFKLEILEGLECIKMLNTKIVSWTEGWRVKGVAETARVDGT